MTGSQNFIDANEVQLLKRFGAESVRHRRMAREIHDTVAAHMVSANLLLAGVRQRTQDVAVRHSLDELEAYWQSAKKPKQPA